MIQEPAIQVGWGRFALRMAVFLIWMIVSPALGAAMIAPALPPAARAIAAVFVAGPALLWVLMLQRRRARSDEFDGGLVTMALAAGAQWALLFGPLCLAVNAAATAFGVRSGPSLEHIAFGLLCAQPAGAAFFGEWMAQHARSRYAKEAR